MSKTKREFLCRDDLWARVEALAKRRGIDADDVVQAALVQLFSKKKPASNDASKSSSSGAAPRRAAAKPATVPARPASSGARLPPPAAARAPARASTPPPQPAARRGSPDTVYLEFEGQIYPVTGDQFVIGRGSKYSDLAIKDANISRRHCAVVRRNGGFYIKDLGSTNGVEFEGQRVDDHPVEEGNVYRLCDHELRFTFVPPQ